MSNGFSKYKLTRKWWMTVVLVPVLFLLGGWGLREIYSTVKEKANKIEVAANKADVDAELNKIKETKLDKVVFEAHLFGINKYLGEIKEDVKYLVRLHVNTKKTKALNE